jgi:uncharacterized membrane protein
MNYLRSAIVAEAFAFPFVKPEVFWPYFLGLAVLVIGLVVILRDRSAREPGMERFIMWGPLFFAVPMAVFAGDHFAFPTQTSQMVPDWMPWHMFWVYFVGTALVSGGLSLALKKFSRLAALLLGLMLFCFVLMMHIPNLIANPGDRFALALMLRDLSFSCGALAFAIGEPQGVSGGGSQIMRTMLRCAIAVAAVIFGVEHFLHPNFVPVIPLRRELPAWLPGHVALSYTTGVVLIAAGVALMTNRKARQVATWLGTFVFAVVLVVYVPILLAGPSDNERLNYVADTLVYSGSTLLLAGAMPRRHCRKSSTGDRAATIAA